MSWYTDMAAISLSLNTNMTSVTSIIGTLRYTTARRYYGYHDRKGLEESTSRQSAKFSVRSRTNYKEAQSKE